MPSTCAKARPRYIDVDDYVLAETCIHVPLHGRDGQVRAWALIDVADAAIALRGHWHLSPTGYAVRTDSHGPIRNIRLHREVMGVTSDRTIAVDHINRDRLDNRRSNLRLCSEIENSQNRGALGGTSIYRNVCWHKARGRWVVRVRHNGSSHFVGYFDDELEAAHAAEAYRRAHVPFAQPDPALAA
jgi:hypothetical protein